MEKQNDTKQVAYTSFAACRVEKMDSAAAAGNVGGFAQTFAGSRESSLGDSGRSSQLMDNRGDARKMLLRANQVDGCSDGAVQLSKLKTFLNIASLGIRKAYVHHKRKKREQEAQDGIQDQMVQFEPGRLTTKTLTSVKPEYPAPERFSLEELYVHLEAYEKARHYHATPRQNVESIMSTGLLRSNGGQDVGASGIADKRSQEQNRGYIHIGGDRECAAYYERQMAAHDPETLRVFATPEQQRDYIMPDPCDERNEAYKTGGNDFVPEQLMRGRISEQPSDKLRAIFAVVRSCYPTPESVAVDDVIARHQEAVRCGLTVHKLRPAVEGRNLRDRVIRNVRKPDPGMTGLEQGYESD